MSEKSRLTFMRNLQKLLAQRGKTQADLVQDLNLKQSTVSDWTTGKKYPRIDKVEMLAEYFGVLKSDLTEEKPPTSEDAGGISNQAILEIYNQLTEEEQREVLDFAKYKVQVHKFRGGQGDE